MARAPRRYPRRVDHAELFPELVDVLLLGWSGLARDYMTDDPFRIFTFTEVDLRAVWLTHRARLLAEAGRRRLTRPVWAEDTYEINPALWLRDATSHRPRIGGDDAG